MVTIACTECGKEYQTYPAWLRKVKFPTCSRQCNGKARGRQWATYGHLGSASWSEASKIAQKKRWEGERNPAWKGGVTLKRPKGNYKGVRCVRCPLEWLMMARKDGYIMEHRLVMAQRIGRPLTRTEVVNHKDHNPSNNARSNLELWPTNGDHKRGEFGRFVEGVENQLYLTGMERD